MACGQQKVKGGNGSITASIIASITARRITLNLGVGCAPSCWRIFGFQALGRCLKNCEIGVGFSFAALSVFRLRRAEAASAVWIPHWHWEPFESQGTRAAKRYVNGNLGVRNLLGARRGHRRQLSLQSE